MQDTTHNLINTLMNIHEFGVTLINIHGLWLVGVVYPTPWI